MNNAGNWMGQCTMRTENGYWLITQDDCHLCVEASIPTDPPIEYDLHNGSNLISFPLNGSIGVSNALPDDIESYITAVEIDGTDQVHVGRLRMDLWNKIRINLWVVADNLRKGAALNSIQIAEILFN